MLSRARRVTDLVRRLAVAEAGLGAAEVAIKEAAVAVQDLRALAEQGCAKVARDPPGKLVRQSAPCRSGLPPPSAASVAMTMSCFRIDHSARHHAHAVCGHDPVMGFFVDVMRGDSVIASYDCFHALFNRSRPLIGCLDFLVSEGFFTGEALEDALAFLQDGAPTPNDMRVVEIVLAFERAAG